MSRGSHLLIASPKIWINYIYMNINAIFYKEKKIEFWEERIFHNPLCEIWKFIIFIKYLSTHNYKKRSTRHTQYIKDEWRDVYTQNITLLIYAMTTIDWYTTATKTYQPPPALIKRKKVVTCYWEVNICYSNHNSTHLVPRVYNLINFFNKYTFSFIIWTGSSSFIQKNI